MFRMFLVKKLLSDEIPASVLNEGPLPEPKSANKSDVRQEGARNRRVFQRFSVDHKHLVLMNDQDILMVRDLSSKGFSTLVGSRCAERLKIGDVYQAKIRYLSESHDLKCRVTWKDREQEGVAPEKRVSQVGFETIDAPQSTWEFTRRLLKPFEVAASMSHVEHQTTDEASRIWLHGSHGSDLFIWTDPSSQQVAAWQFQSAKWFCEWSERDGLRTGNHLETESNVKSALYSGQDAPKGAVSYDRRVDDAHAQFTQDVIMALGEDVLTLKKLQEAILTQLHSHLQVAREKLYA